MVHAHDGRMWPKSMSSLPRTPKTWPGDVLGRVGGEETATGAMCSGPIFLIFSTRAFWASVSVGMVPIIRVQAKGEMQLAVTL